MTFHDMPATITFYPLAMWAYRLPPPPESAVTRICHPTPHAKTQARRRRELSLFVAAEGRLKRLGLPTSIEDIEREALAMHATLEALDTPRLTPTEADAIDRLRDAAS